MLVHPHRPRDAAPVQSPAIRGRDAAAELEDRVTNRLTVAVGYLGLLRDDPRLPPDLRTWVGEALLATEDAAATVHRYAERGRAGPPAAPRKPHAA